MWMSSLVIQLNEESSLKFDKLWELGKNRENKIHVYRIRQTANVSWKFLRIENKQIKTVQNDSCGQNWQKTAAVLVSTKWK